MSDEQAYRGNTHPPYCTCVQCQERRKPGTQEGLITRLLRILRLKR